MRLIEVATKKGTYAAVTPSKDTQKAVEDYQKANKISNTVSGDKLHTTLLYSRKHLPDYKSAGTYDKPMVGTVKGFEVWESAKDDDGNTTNCLVLTYDCPELKKRHKDLMKEHGGTYDFDEYKPHITLSYDFGDGDVDKLPKFEDSIEITSEYGEDLDLNWAKENT